MTYTTPWYKASGPDTYERVVSTFQTIDGLQIGKRSRYARYLSLYEGRVTNNLDDYIVDVRIPDSYDEESRENIIRPAVDALVAKISTNDPRLVTQTNGADFELQQKAKQRTLMVEGVIQDQNGYRVGRQVFRDGLIWDFGALKVTPCYESQKVIYERLFPHEVVVDEQDGKYGDPKCMYLLRIYNKEQLKAHYPDKGYIVENGGMVRDSSGARYRGDSEDMCAVIEAYHLPSGPDANDGRCVICTTRGVLEDYQWRHNCFPVAIWRWKKRQVGWNGFGAVEDIENYQRQLDFLDRKIGYMLNSLNLRVWMQHGSGVNPADISNEYDGLPIGEYKTSPPIFAPDPNPPDALFMERERKKQAAFEQLGLSLLLAQSKKPSGLNSGVALREYKDTESERYRDVGKQWEDFWIDTAELTLLALEDLYEHVPNCKITVPLGGGLEKMSLSKADWTRDRYKIQIRPSGLLPREPAGRLETIRELSAIYPESVKFLASKLNNPDIDDAMGMVSAPVSAIQADIESMTKGESVMPEPFIDLQLALGMVLRSYQKLNSQNAPESILEAHRAYLLEIHSIIQSQQQAAMAAMAAQQDEMRQQEAAQNMPQPGLPPGPGGV